MNKASDKTNTEIDGVRLGQVIRQAREDLRLSIRQAAEALHVHHSFIARLESGDYQTAKPAVLQRLSRVLELDERDLFALAGLDAPEGLPTFTPYLRAKYEISDEAAQALQEYFTFVSEQVRHQGEATTRGLRGISTQSTLQLIDS